MIYSPRTYSIGHRTPSDQGNPVIVVVLPAVSVDYLRSRSRVLFCAFESRGAVTVIGRMTIGNFALCIGPSLSRRIYQRACTAVRASRIYKLHFASRQ